MKPCRLSAIFKRLPGDDSARMVVHCLSEILPQQLVVATFFMELELRWFVDGGEQMKFVYFRICYPAGFAQCWNLYTLMVP